MSSAGGSRDFSSPLRPIDANARFTITGSLKKLFSGKSDPSERLLSKASSPVLCRLNATAATPPRIAKENSPIRSERMDAGRQASKRELTPVLVAYGGIDSVGDYDGNLHLPRYSQSEMDAVVEENSMVVNSLKRKIDELSSDTQAAKVSKNGGVEVEKFQQLELQLQEERRKALEYMEKADEICLVKMQNKALSHRLKEIEDETEQRILTSVRELTEALDAEVQKRKALKMKHAQELEELESSIKSDVLDKAKAQFEAQQTKFNALVDDYNALRARYEERSGQLRAAEESLHMMQEQLETGALESAAKDSDLVELREQLDALRRDKTALVNASVSTQASAAALQDEIARLREELNEVKQQTAISAFELSERDSTIRSMRLEMETQLSVIGKLTSAQMTLEQQLDQVRLENTALLAKNQKLRSMNKEMITMLEERG